jgi:hypothetical protein
MMPTVGFRTISIIGFHLMGDWSLYVEAGNTQTRCYLDGFSKTFSVIFDYGKLKMRISVTSKGKNLEFMGLLFEGSRDKQDQIVLRSYMITLGGKKKTLKTFLKNSFVCFLFIASDCKTKRWILSKAKLIRLIVLWPQVQMAISVPCSVSADRTRYFSAVTITAAWL